MSNPLLDSYFYKLEYTIKLPEEDYTSEEVYTLYHLRFPILKTAPIVCLTIPIEFYRLKVIQETVENSSKLADYLDIEIEYSLADHAKIIQKQYNISKKIKKKNYKIIHCEIVDKEQLNKGTQASLTNLTCRLILTNPVLHFLQNINKFNRLLKNVTPIELIYQFGDYLLENFKDFFELQLLHSKNQINDFKYEHLLAASTNDLMIPKQIDDSYKIFKYPSYSFFDDFSPTDKDITFYNVCLGSPNIFNKIDVYGERTDAFYGSRIIANHPLTDLNNRFVEDLDSSRITIRQREGFHKTINPKIDKIKIPIFQVNNEEPDSEGGKPYKDFSSLKMEKEGHNTYNLYAPDSFDNGLERFLNTSTFFKKNIAGLFEYQWNDVHWDFFQFNCAYNLDFITRNQYNYVPISICNIFYRAETKVPIFRHTNRIMFLKYTTETE